MQGEKQKTKTKRTRKEQVVEQVEITTDVLIQIFINEISKITNEIVKTNERINEIAEKLTPKKIRK